MRGFSERLAELLDGLADPWRSQMKQQADLLAQSGALSPEGLKAAIEDGSLADETRGAAFWLVGQMPIKSAIPSLLRLLRDAEASVRREAADALGRMKSKRPIEPLIEAMLCDSNLEVREAAAYALGNIDDNRAVEPMLKVLTDSSEPPTLRGIVAEQLGWLGDTRAVPALLAALEDQSVEVRFWAVHALGWVGRQDVIPRLQAVAATDKAVLPPYGPIDKEARESIDTIARMGRIEDRKIDDRG